MHVTLLVLKAEIKNFISIFVPSSYLAPGSMLCFSWQPQISRLLALLQQTHKS